MDEPDVELVGDDILNLSTLFNKHNMDPTITFDDDFILVELEKDTRRMGGYKRYLDNFNNFGKSNESSIDDEWDGWEEEQYKPVDDEDEQQEGEMGELAYWIRQMFKANKIDSSVETENYDLMAYIFFEKKEKMSKLLSVFEVINKIKKDLLIYYSVEVELYENKTGFPIMKFTFSWSGESDEIEMEDEKAPF
jgi:hypothetical protein